MEIYKLLVLSDAHLSRNSKEDQMRWYPGIVKFLKSISSFLVNLFLKFLDNQTQKCLHESISRIDKNSYDLVVSLGDNTPGTNESGLITEAAAVEAAWFWEIIGKYFCFSGGRASVPGGHDLGYRGPIGTKGAGGMTPESINANHEMHGSIYGCRQLTEDVNFVWFAAEPFLAVGDRSVVGYTPEELHSTSSFIDEICIDQLAFLADCLERIRANNKRVILAAHEAEVFTIPIVQELFDVFLGSKEFILATLVGHYHYRWLGEFMQFKYEKIREVFRKYKMQVIPSTWGSPFSFLPGRGIADIKICGRQAVLTIYYPNGKTSEIMLV